MEKRTQYHVTKTGWQLKHGETKIIILFEANKWLGRAIMLKVEQVQELAPV